jgi:ABC-type ATPase involved in cell division/GNAT superfamily N-acetyltransferase
MPHAHITRSIPIARTPRVMQLEGLFEVAPSQNSEVAWDVDLPLEARDWSVGLIVGPSGCGKSTLARELFGSALISDFNWPDDQSVVDAFPAHLGIKEITALLSSVGFSSPPHWLRPFRVLSNGEQFRVTLARALAESRSLMVIDEFTSVVDRTVAQVGSAAVAKTIRRRQQKLIAVTCHYDVIDWLQPDWIYEPATDAFQWRSLRRRPAIPLTIRRVHRQAWRLFQRYHYLATNIHPSARCFIALWDERPVAFTAALPFPHAQRPGWREHRTVCLPDFQGVGIGNALSDYVGGLFRSTGKPYRSTTSNPAMIQHRAGSPLWTMVRKPSRVAGPHTGFKHLKSSCSRITASFEYRGPALKADARAFGII